MELKDILITLELFLLSLFLTPLPVICAGNAAGIVFTVLLILLTFYFEALGAFAYLALAGALTMILCGVVLTIKMKAAANDFPESGMPCTLIVLGCKVRNGRPTRMLRRRLNAAIEYLQRENKAVCIVSGGRGKDESISEAEAMYSYMTAHGISSERIYREDRSSTTLENLKFSARLIKENDLPENAAVATDGFHQYRAAMLADRIGMSVKAVPAHTEPRFAPTYYVREWIAILAYKFIK